MGKAFATLRLTAPTSQRKVDATLGTLQKHANRLVFGRRWLTEQAATQPRSALGVGHLQVAKYAEMRGGSHNTLSSSVYSSVCV